MSPKRSRCCLSKTMPSESRSEQALQPPAFGRVVRLRRARRSRVSPGMPAILVSDVKLPAWTGSDYCASPWGGEDLPIISVTGHGDITMAVQAMREGAC